MNVEHEARGEDDGDVARLLARTGPRVTPSAAATAAVRAAVESEWRRQVSARQSRRVATRWALAAGLAVAAVGTWLARPLYLEEPVTVATLVRVVGEVQVESRPGEWRPLAAGGSVESGAVLRTGDDGRAALELPGGVQLRLDAGTQLAMNDEGRASLSQGAVYVDSGDAGAGAAFTLDTPAGDVRHLGTQYEARIDGPALAVGVREGRVEITGPRASVIGNAGEQLVIDAGHVTRNRLDPHAAAWAWVESVVPPFSIEGRTVEQFLAWAGRETGHEVVYSAPELRDLARSVTLSGTVEGLPPQQAVGAVLATTSLSTRVIDGRIEVLPSAR